MEEMEEEEMEEEEMRKRDFAILCLISSGHGKEGLISHGALRGRRRGNMGRRRRGF